LSALVRRNDPTLDAELSGKLDATVARMEAIKARAEGAKPMTSRSEGNTEGNATVQAAIDALVDQTKSIERAVSILARRHRLRGSDSLDAPDKVFQ
jgi:putative iron-regulated protein